MLQLLAFAATLVAAVTAAGIHSVDFDNFTYPHDLVSDWPANVPFTFHHGSFQYEIKQDFIKIACSQQKVVYGDLTGDGHDDAAVTLWCTTGGTGFFTEAYVYTMKDGKAALMASLPGGDRGDHGIYRVRITKQSLLIVRGDVTEGVCCPERFAETTYRWDGKSFVSIGVRHFSGTTDDFLQ